MVIPSRRIESAHLGSKLRMQASAPSRTLPLAVTVVVALVVTAVVVVYGWISDDGFITFRYAANVLAGHGSVFNPGERVQGYTHPLWMFLLVFGLVFTKNAIIVAVVLGAGLTLATFGIFGATLARRAREPMVAAVAILILGVIFASSEAWRSFQTSGLENSLSHFLIALLVLELFRERPRPFALSLIASLMVLTRPDLVPLVAPLGLVALYEYRTREGFMALAAGTAPLLLWLAFSLIYYGDLVPNTARAKLGIYPSIGDSVSQGWIYLRDWISYEPVPAAAAALLLATGAALARRPLQWALVAGALLYVCYVVFIGGDFMRGRFMLAFFVTGCLFGTAAIVHAERFRPSRELVLAAGVLVLIATTVFGATAREQDRSLSHGIVNERLFYTGLHLTHYIADKRLDTPFYEPAFAQQLEDYESACGPLTIHSLTTGKLGYDVRGIVDVIDLVGLTDEYIAGLPRENLIVSPPRPGHPYKRIPIAYLAGRNDVSIFADWQEAIARKDCSLRDRPAALVDSKELYEPKVPK